MPSESYKKIMVVLFYICFGVAAAYVFFKYLFPVFLPFLIAWVIALALQRVVNFLHEKCRIPKKISVPFLVLIVISVLGLVLYLLVNRVYQELNTLSQSATSFLDKIKNDPEYADMWIQRINSVVPFIDVSDELREIWRNLDAKLQEVIFSFAGQLSGSIIPFIGSMISFIPNAFFYIFVIILSAYYFAVDFDNINRKIISVLPKKLRKYTSYLKTELKGTIGKFLRAYGIIISITFIELFAFLSIIGIKYAFLIALITSFIDILPVLGTGTVMIPWIGYHLILGDTYTGIALLIAYIIITVVRQIIEPKIIGKFVGLSPLLTLISMYAGLKLMGVAGLFLFPIVSIILMSIYQNGGFRRSEPGEIKKE